MSVLYERLKKLCDDRGIKGPQLCDAIDYKSHNLLTELKSGRKKTLTAEVAHKIADYFSVSIAYILGETENPSAENSKGESKRFVCSYEDEAEQGFETVNINVNTLGDITELVECVKGLSSEKIQLLISVAKSMK